MRLWNVEEKELWMKMLASPCRHYGISVEDNCNGCEYYGRDWVIERVDNIGADYIIIMLICSHLRVRSRFDTSNSTPVLG